MRCPSCNKFATQTSDSNDPEVDVMIEVTEIDDSPTDIAKAVDAKVTGTVRIVLTSECCGDELKEYTFDVDEEITVERGEGCECDLEGLDVEMSCDNDDYFEGKKVARKDGTVVERATPSRYQTHYYGATGTIDIKCECGKTTASQEWKDNIPSSSMDEMC